MNGIHAIIEARGALAHLSAEELVALMEKAAGEAGATVLGSNVHAFGPGFGNTGVVLLAESHITVHTWPEDDYAAFDIFMCGDQVSLQRAVSVIKARDPCGHYHVKVIERGVKHSQTTSLESVAEEILMEIPLLEAKLQSNLSLDKSRAAKGLVELLKFLTLCSDSSTPLQPSRLINDIWCEFILFTRAYSALCERHLNGFIHYQPVSEAGEALSEYQNTIDKYLESFGSPDPIFWTLCPQENTHLSRSELNYNNDTRG